MNFLATAGGRVLERVVSMYWGQNTNYELIGLESMVEYAVELVCKVTKLGSRLRYPVTCRTEKQSDTGFVKVNFHSPGGN